MDTDKKIKELFDNFNDLKVLIIGDVMLDSYLWGAVSRISPEAPVPIVALKKRESRLGGAANVALNIKSLGAKPILCSLIGDDDKNSIFNELMHKEGLDTSALIKSPHRLTTEKFRIIGNNMQMLRVDEESIMELRDDELASLMNVIYDLVKNKNIDVIIFEDYDKGVISSELINKVVTLANQRNIPVAVDPKKKNFLNYKNVTLFKPNLKELKEGLKIEIDANDKEQLVAALHQLLDKLKADTGLLTMSDKGMMVCNKSDKPGSYNCKNIPASIIKISDVSGAGDTVISVAALCKALGTDAEFMAKLSNLAGGLVCEHVGVVPIDKEKLLEEALKMAKYFQNSII